MQFNLTENQVKYITKYMGEHLQLTREGIREYWRDGYIVPDEDIEDLNTLKGIMVNLSLKNKERVIMQ